MREPLFLEALHQWDKAQVVVLGEGDIAPPAAVASLVKAVAEMEKEGVVEARTALWNVIHGGEEYMRKFSEEEHSGWLHLGRSSPSLRVTASRIAFRNILLQIMSSALDLRAKFIDVAEQTQKTHAGDTATSAQSSQERSASISCLSSSRSSAISSG